MRWLMALFLFICKTHHNGYIVPGKLVVGKENICFIAENGVEYQYKAFELLFTPPGTVSWVVGSGRFLPSKSIGGYHQNGDVAYICISGTEDNLVGKYFFGNEGRCFTSSSGVEMSNNVFEILTKDFFADAFEV